MFGKKPPQVEVPLGTSAPEEERLRISTIPEDFYGGKDPAVYSTKKPVSAPEPVELTPPPPPEPEPEEEAPIVTPPPKKPSGLVVAIIIVVLAILGATGYYLYSVGFFAAEEAPAEPIPTPTPIEEPELIEEPEEEPEIIEEQEEEPEDPVRTPTSTRTAQIEFPPVLLTDSNDLDFDELTDAEEEVLGTDPGIWDTDEDGYYDGLEVMNLYNPTGFAPIRIIDSRIVQEFINPLWEYRAYYPETWTSAVVDNSARDVLFSSITGDYIAVYVRAMEPGEDLTRWIIRQAPGQRITDLEQFENRFQIEGYTRSDGLVAYFTVNDLMYVIAYYPSAGSDVRFRNIMEMVVQSFRPDNRVVDIPDQEMLPGVDAPAELLVSPPPVVTTTSEVSTSAVVDTYDESIVY